MNRRVRAAIALLMLLSFGLLSGAVLFAQSPRARTRDRYAARLRLFAEFVKKQMAQDKIPGLTIGFTKDDYTWVEGFGYADLENKIPARADSAYRLASVTKTMTGTAIVQLVEKGKINLDAEIQTYLPYYPKQKWPVTVRQLLVHTGGNQSGSGVGPEYVTPREVVARIAKYPIQSEPGVKFEYTTSGYNLLGAAIEEVSGKSFGEYLRENIWTPLGMKDTRMDNVREIIPNRVRGYELVNGEIRNAPFIDVSSRFGGGGANGTVPDLLRWANSIESGRVLSKQSLNLMFTPVASRGGRYLGLDDGSWYYTLGWMVFPVNGRYVFYNDGGQVGTNTMVLRVPSLNLTMAFACNLQAIDRMPYVKRLYDIVTNEPWDISVYTKDKVDEAVYKGMSSTFNYGSLHFDQTGQPYQRDAQKLAQAFAYFNRAVNRDSLQASFADTLAAINDGRHPVADAAFIAVGSYMALKLGEKYGMERARRYHTGGAIPFFADYIELYKTSPQYPQELRFSESFEKLVARWNQDWTRTWNEYARHLDFAPGANTSAMEAKLVKLFSGAEVYPNLINPLLDLRRAYESQKEWEKAAQPARAAASLYPLSDTTNAFYAISLVLAGRTDEARAPLRKAATINPNGIASARVLNQISSSIAALGKPEEGIEWLKLALEIYPREAILYGSIGDLQQKQGRREQAIEAYKKALELDPKFAPAEEALKKLTK